MNKCLTAVLAIAVLALPMAGQDSAFKQNEQILAELRQIRVLLETKLNEVGNGGGPGPLPALSTAVEVGTTPFLGSKTAPVTIVEYSDFECPYCSRFYVDIFPDLKKNYIDSGKVRFYPMDFPLGMHANALKAAEAGRCAGEQQQYWSMHDRMHRNPQKLAMENLVTYAKDAGLDVTSFQRCLDSGKYTAAVQDSINTAASKAVRGTPTFVIGKSTVNGVEGTMIVGIQPYDAFDKMLRALVSGNAQ